MIPFQCQSLEPVVLNVAIMMLTIGQYRRDVVMKEQPSSIDAQSVNTLGVTMAASFYRNVSDTFIATLDDEPYMTKISYL